MSFKFRHHNKRNKFDLTFFECCKNKFIVKSATFSLTF